MPYWPIPVTITIALIVAGVRVGAHRVPALVLLGYLAARLWITFGSPVAHEVGMGLIWAIVAMGLIKLHSYIPATAFLLSGATYPSLKLLGFQLEYLGLMAVIAELFAVVALLGIGGGIAGLYYNRRHSGLPSGLSAFLVNSFIGTTKAL